MRKTTPIALVVGVAVALSGCGRDEPAAESPQPGAHLPQQTTTTRAQPVQPLLEEDLPAENNQDIDWADPTSVAESWLLMRTTFLASDIEDPQRLVARSDAATTEQFRERNAPVTNPDVVHTRSWFHMEEPAGDPVVSVNSMVELAHRANPVFGDDEQAVRELRVTQTPVTESGRELRKRRQLVTVTLTLEDGRWLVDDATFRDT